MALFDPHVSKDATLYVQDISVLFGGESDMYTTDQSNSDRWTIIAICANNDVVDKASKVKVSVIPTDKFTPAVKKKMRAGDFKDKVSCQDVK